MSKSVLIVEDDRVSREALASLVRSMGHQVCAVWSAEDAKSAPSTFTPDIAVLDVRLPGIPGDAFAVYLRHKVPTIKIIFVSGDFRLDAPERFGSEVNFLPKPLNFEKLLHAIQS